MKTILVPTDFSASAQNALHYAANLAKNFNSKFIILNSYTFPVNTVDPLQKTELLLEPENKSISGLELIKREITRKYDLSEVICLSKSGSPTENIVQIIKDYDVDALVMGITGQAGMLKEKIIGSTTLDMARDIETPLFIIPEGIEFKKIDSMAFACDIYNLHGSKVLENVKNFCRHFNADLEIINVEKQNEDPPIRARNYNFMESNLKDLKHQTIILQDDDDQNTLENYFKNKRPDLIVLNPKKQNFLQSLFHKSMTKKMIFHMKAPMLIVH